MNRTAQRLQGVLGVLAILAFLVGVPTILVKAGMTPWTTDWGSVRERLSLPDNGTLLVTLLGLVAWVGWAYFTIGFIADLAGRAQGARIPRVPGFGLSQGVARRVIDVAALAFTAVPTLTAYAAPAQAAGTAVVAPLDPSLVPDAAPDKAPAAEEPAAPAPATTDYTVRRGDSLWRIAEQHLGDPHRWTEIHELNRAALGNEPDLITAGTVLRLSHDATPVAASHEGTYVVEPGDTLSQIAKDELGNASAYPQIVEASQDIVQPGDKHLVDPDHIEPGWVLDLGPTAAPPLSVASSAPIPDEVPKDAGAPEPSAAPSPEPEAPARTATPATTPVPTQQSGAPSSRLQSPSTSEAREAHDRAMTPAWFLPGLAGAGSILGAGVFLTVRARRRSQLRFREPGRIVTPIPATLRAVDETVRAAGGPLAGHLAALDRALRALASTFVDPERYPRVLTVQLTATRIRLSLAEDAELLAPWVGAERTWSAPVDADYPDIALVPPYPMLVSIGEADDGALWLLNVEQVRALNITGHAETTESFARHIATELATSPWSYLVMIEAIGTGVDLDDLNGYRLKHHADVASSSLEQTVADIEKNRDDVWWDPDPYAMFILGPSIKHGVWSRAVSALTAHCSRSGVAVVAINADDLDGAAVVEIGEDQRLRVASLGIDIRAAVLSGREGAAVAGLLAAVEIYQTEPMPPDLTTTTGIAPFVDLAGAFRADFVLPRADGRQDHASALLPHATTEYTETAALTSDDVEQLAPGVDSRVARDIIEKDPDLDRDIAWWRQGNDCPVPRVQLLGPITISGNGKSDEVLNRRQHYAELAMFLKTFPHGARAKDVAEAFHISDQRARVDVSALRGFLTERHLPKATHTEAGPTTWSGYRIEGVLFDTELFTRLRARAQALGGEDGIPYLVAALELVRGEPFTDRRTDTWAWLREREPLDQIMAAAVVDVSLTLHGHFLHETTRDLPKARWAAEIALTASPFDEPARFALAAVADAEGNHAEAEAIRKNDIWNRSDDERAPLDAPPRTAALRRRS